MNGSELHALVRTSASNKATRKLLAALDRELQQLPRDIHGAERRALHVLAADLRGLLQRVERLAALLAQEARP